MIEFEKYIWDKFVSNFSDRLLRDGYSAEYALKCFLKEYWTELDVLSREAGLKDDEEVEEESLDIYFERRMKPVWNHVYDLQKRVNALESRCPQKYSLSTDSKVYPNWTIPQTRCDVNGAVGSAGDGGSGGIGANLNTGAGSNGGSGLGFATSGYMQVVDKIDYTPQQINEWNELRFDDPATRK